MLHLIWAILFIIKLYKSVANALKIIKCFRWNRVSTIGVARNSDWEGEAKTEKFCDAILVTFFGDVMAIRSLKRRHNWFFEVQIRQNQLEKPEFGQIM